MVLEYEPKITKKYLLERQTQETYLEYYLGIPVKKRLFKSPLRNDNSPTCSFIGMRLETSYSMTSADSSMVISLVWLCISIVVLIIKHCK